MGAQIPRGPIEPTFIEAHRLCVEASLRLKDLAKEITELRDTGRLNEARKLMKDADEIRSRIMALQAHYRWP